MRKLLTVFTVIVAVAFSALCLGACSQAPSAEQQIRDSLTQELDTVKSLDPEIVSAMEQGVGSSVNLADYGVDSQEFVKSYFEGFDYTIDSVTVDGDSAEATVTITCKSLSDFQAKMEDGASDLLDQVTNGETIEDINTAIGDVVVEAIGQTELAQTEPITIDYNLVNGTWEPSLSASSVLSIALTEL